MNPTTTTPGLVDTRSWQLWLASPTGTRTWSHWAADHPELDDWSPEQLQSPQGSSRTDAMQAVLVKLAQSGEDDAAITLLVQLRPGLYRLVTQTERVAGLGRAESADEVRATFFETVCRHRLDRRPRRIAANLMLDTRQRLARSGYGTGPVCDRARGELVDPGDQQIDHEYLASTLALTEQLRIAIESLPGRPGSKRLSAELAVRAWLLDQPRDQIGAELGMTVEAVNTRLHRLRRSLADRSHRLG